ncbi:hypothetical protein FAEPRAA2165_02803 [Faecalibacterium duncaniae]|uniref:Uncharacterized protein n=1 Tax=Faecalibacterium duncaniae (strain DSM 17677 / JCM 31915 / A2-165) TaxID=411483 RepID=C7H906_FAED2|nr:hypothetical protein FAEPRAA2165_02803 [Faecalibacterium duncaniae]
MQGSSTTKVQWGFICPFLYENLVDKKAASGRRGKHALFVRCCCLFCC